MQITVKTATHTRERHQLKRTHVYNINIRVFWTYNSSHYILKQYLFHIQQVCFDSHTPDINLHNNNYTITS
jgi:hypothetical protein